MFKKISVSLVASPLVLSVAGCSGCSAETEAQAETEVATIQSKNIADSGQEGIRARVVKELSDLEIRFDYNGESFILRLYNNDIAAEITGDMDEVFWNLPTYHYDDFKNYGVMQYYNIPGRYTIPSGPEIITSERAEGAYYSEPSRMVLFYHDTEVTREYTKVSTIEGTGELSEVVENNPALEDWGNKVVSIQWAQQQLVSSRKRWNQMKEILSFMMATSAMTTLAACQKSGVNTALAQATAEVIGPGIVGSWAETEVGLSVVSNQADTGAAAIEDAPWEKTSEPALMENEKIRIRIVTGENTIVFKLNGSATVKSLYRQLPLSSGVENFSGSERIFYPPGKLDVTDIPQATSGMSTLAYHAPWGDMVMFCGDCSPNGQLCELGQAVSGAENVHNLSGILQIGKDEQMIKPADSWSIPQ